MVSGTQQLCRGSEDISVLSKQLQMILYIELIKRCKNCRTVNFKNRSVYCCQTPRQLIQLKFTKSPMTLSLMPRLTLLQITRSVPALLVEAQAISLIQRASQHCHSQDLSRWSSQFSSRDTADNVDSEMTSLAQHKLPASTLSKWQKMYQLHAKMLDVMT